MPVDKRPYSRPAAKCHVRNPIELERFREKRDEWLDWFQHDAEHAISDQISEMMWSDALFRLINESRNHAHRAGGGYATQNGLIAQALDKGYVAEQLIAFRRLLEPAAKKPSRQVVSLRRLIDDVEAHRDLISREHFICHDGLPFDGEASFSQAIPDPQSGRQRLDTKALLPFAVADGMHRAFDDMLDGPPGKRRPDDKIGDSFFKLIEKALSEAPFERAKHFANKRMLHAADLFSRGEGAVPGVRLQDFWDCQHAILWAATRIGMAIGASDIGAIPTPQFDVLEFWTKPFAPRGSLEDLRTTWEEENSAREEWRTRRPG